MISEAEFSPCGKYRFMLRRIWNEDKPIFMYIGLNPSTANQTKNDATIRKLIRITDANGGGGFYMLNLFTFISSDPQALHTAETPDLGADIWIETVSLIAERIVFCWGSLKSYFGPGEMLIKAHARAVAVIIKYDNAACLFINADQNPKHPLYCKDKTIFMPFVNRIN